MNSNPAYIELRRIEAAREIANLLSKSNNKVYLDADSLFLNLT
jgi:prohibitin 2